MLLTQLVTDHCREKGFDATNDLNVKPSQFCGPDSDFRHWRSPSFFIMKHDRYYIYVYNIYYIYILIYTCVLIILLHHLKRFTILILSDLSRWR